MSERNKLMSVLVVGLLVGFGVGRLVPQNADTIQVPEDTNELVEDATDVDVVVDTSVDSAETGGQLSASLVSLTSSLIDRPQVVKAGYGVEVRDQLAGEMVTVSSVAVTGSTWVAIHADRDGAPGNVFGARRIETNASGVEVSLLRSTERGMKYYILLQEDNGNGKYDLYSDAEIISQDGLLIFDSFIAK
ncbi:MAG: hypothetical protein Q8P93_01095 [bacterium]|nr:hypothetical protein [bacterium]